MITTAHQGPTRLHHVTDSWIGELDRELGWNDKPRTYRLLTAVLRAMRAGTDASARVEGADFPVRLCGTHCDDLPKSLETDGRHQFLDRVALAFKPDALREGAVETVVGMLPDKLGEIELATISQCLPSELRCNGLGRNSW